MQLMYLMLQLNFDLIFAQRLNAMILHFLLINVRAKLNLFINSLVKNVQARLTTMKFF